MYDQHIDEMSTHVYAKTELSLWSVLQAALMVNVVHNTRRQDWKVKFWRRWFVVQTVSPVSTVK